MKLPRLAGLAALAVLAVGQAWAEPEPFDNGLGFGIIRDLTPVLRPVILTPQPAGDEGTDSPKIEQIQFVRSDAAPKE